ncbi:MAG: alanine racemase [Terrimesophilobacter sp.]
MTFVQTVPGSHEIPRVARPTALCTIDHAVIAENIRLLRSKTDAKFMAVVKADAFGHGAVQVAATALAAGAAWLGVATVDEALQLRRAGVTAPILAWLVDPWSDIAGALRTQVTVSCANHETLEAVAGAAAVAGIRADVHLEVDTGMSRAGTPAALWPSLCAQAKRGQDDQLVRVTGVWSHLALATDPDWSGVEPAWQAFHAGIDVALAAGLTPQERHLANSAATLAHPRTAFTMVRCGASVYGIETVDGMSYGLKYALRAVSHVTQLRRVPAGVGVGYGQKFVTERPTTLGLIPVGYADGVPRSLGGVGEIVLGATRYPIVGAVSMDQFSVDFGDALVRLGDEVVLLGDAAIGEPDAAEWATIAGTLPHEILTGLGGRMKRKHIRNP